MDLSSSINRLRFDGLASSVYRQVGSKLTSIVSEAGLDLSQIDEVLLAGSSTLFPGLQSHLSLLVPPTTPVTSTFDPAEVIAVGCALQALHLATLEDDLKIQDVLDVAGKDSTSTVGCLAKPIGLVIPGSEGDELSAKILEAGAPLPTRRRVSLKTENGTKKVILEIWEGEDSVKVEKAEKAPIEKDEDDEDEDDEDEEDEETKTPITKKTSYLGSLELEVGGKEVMVELVVLRNGTLQASAWEEGKESSAVKFEL